MYKKTKSSVSSPYQILVKIDEVKHSFNSGILLKKKKESIARLII